jgi:uncharacterized protein YbjQ (UPF0145 family)
MELYEMREVVGHVFIARVIWSRIEGSTMADMRNVYSGEDVAYSDTYENAIEQALPFCREKTELMHNRGYTKDSHATISVREEIITSKKYTVDEAMEESMARMEKKEE